MYKPILVSLLCYCSISAKAWDAAGASGYRVDSPEGLEEVSLGGYIYIDSASDGYMDGSDTGIAGVVVELFTPGQEPTLDPPIATATTNTNGFYHFIVTQEGTYIPRVPNTQFTTGPLHTMWQTPFTGSDNGVWKDNSSDSTETGNLMLYGNYGHAVVLDAGEEVLGEPANKEVTIVVADSSADFSIDMGFTVSQESCYLIVMLYLLLMEMVR
jgi:hypothetical protein